MDTPAIVSVTPDELRRLADAEEEVARQASETSRLALAKAELYRRTADALEGAAPAPTPAPTPPPRLQTVRVSSTTSRMNTHERRNVQRSATQNKTGSPLIAAANAKGYSMRRLAKEMGILPATLSSYTSGLHSIPRARAEQIEAIIGYPALPENYPDGITEPGTRRRR